MDKLKIVVLELDGDLEQKGFQVTLKIGDDNEPNQFQVRGNLPANPILAAHLEKHWQEKYRTLGAPYRISPRTIIRNHNPQQMIRDCKISAENLRQQLREWLESPSFRELDKQLRVKLNSTDTVRFLISTDNQQLAKLPWQEWDIFEAYQGAEIAFSARDFESPSKQEKSFAHQLKILAILGHSQDLDVDKDRQNIQALPHSHVIFLVEPSRQEFSEQLWEQSWDILFFAGHSETEGERGVIYLNPQESLSLDELKNGLNKAISHGLKLAIFNSCDGLGLVKQLGQLKIPNIIVMREPVPDKVAHAFLQYFLSAFVKGNSLYLAVRKAREKLEGLEGEFPCASWLPVIYQNQATVKFHGKLPSKSPELPDQELPWWKALVTIFLVSLMSTSAWGGLRWFGALQPGELWAYDLFTRIKPIEKPVTNPRILVVTIDHQDLDYQDEKSMGRGRSSLADSALVKVLAELEKLNPSVMGLDIYHPHRFSPELVKYFQQEKIPFYTVCKRNVSNEIPGVKPPNEQDIAPEYWVFSDFVKDADNIVRRHLLTMQLDLGDPCATDVSLSLLIAQHYLHLVSGGIEAENNPQELIIGDSSFPKLTNHTSGYQGIDARGSQMMLNYQRYFSMEDIAQSIPLRTILDQGIPDNLVNQLNSPIVLIGVTAKGENYDDFFNTPYGEEIPGVFLQAQMINQIVSAVLDGRQVISWWSLFPELLWIWAWSFFGGIVVLLARNTWQGQLILLLTLGALFLVCFYLFIEALWIPLIPTVLALVVTTELLLWLFLGNGRKIR